MLYKFVILQKADNEYYDALNWYALQESNLAAKFAADVEVSINRILQIPESYPKTKRGYRQALRETFPYFIVYFVDRTAGLISIVSIFYTSRNPGKKFRT